jgi:hypothetical protein
MTPEDEAQNRQQRRAAGQANLARQYRRIGISAVAAALPYRGDAKNPARPTRSTIGASTRRPEAAS